MASKIRSSSSFFNPRSVFPLNPFRPGLRFARGIFSYPKSPIHSFANSKTRNPYSQISIPGSLSAPHLANPSFVPRSRSLLKPCSQISNPLIKLRCFRCGLGGHLARNCNLPVRCYLCGATGHKRFNCRSYKKKPPVQVFNFASSEGGIDDFMFCRSSWIEPITPMDGFLLDPDVEACLGNRSLGSVQIRSPSRQSDVLLLDVPGLDLVGAAAQGRLESKILSNLRMRLGVGKGIVPSLVSASGRRSILRCRFGKGKWLAAPFRQRTCDMLWGSFGQGRLVPATAPGPPRSNSKDGNGRVIQSPVVNAPLLEDYSSGSPSECLDVDKEDPCSSLKAQEVIWAHAHRSDVPTPLNPKPKKKKGISCKKRLVSGSPIYVRRSPRFRSI